MIGSSVKKLRKRRNVTQKALADWLGVSRQAISMWEADKRELKATTLNKIAKVFGVTVDEILKKHKDSIIGKENQMLRKVRKKFSSQLRKTKFQLTAPEAQIVAVTGCFKEWDTNGIPMKKNRSGVWNVSVSLAPGAYEYKFIVDGQWWTDPVNEKTANTPDGAVNSVKEVTV